MRHPASIWRAASIAHQPRICLQCVSFSPETTSHTKLTNSSLVEPTNATRKKTSSGFTVRVKAQLSHHAMSTSQHYKGPRLVIYFETCLRLPEFCSSKWTVTRGLWKHGTQTWEAWISLLSGKATENKLLKRTLELQYKKTTFYFNYAMNKQTSN